MKEVNDMTKEELAVEIEKMMKDWNNQDFHKKSTSGKSSGKSLTPSFVLLMIEVLMAVLLIKLLV